MEANLYNASSHRTNLRELTHYVFFVLFFSSKFQIRTPWRNDLSVS